jgi:hypothetical protein
MSSTGRGPRLGGEDDFYVTPSWCVCRLLEAWKPPGGTWLEPSAGNGAIIRAALSVRSDVSFVAVELREEERAGLGLIAKTTIGDFLKTEGSGHCSVVIGNPPFSLAMEFIEKARKVAPEAEVCMLLRLNFVGSETRSPFMRAHPPDLYLLPNRPSFTGGKTDSIEYAWFVWPSREPRSSGAFRVLASTPKEERKARA